VPGRLVGPWSWSPDGKILVTLEFSATMIYDIGSLSMGGDPKWRPVADLPCKPCSCAVSREKSLVACDP
jgi:hypothetical protein